MRRGKRALSLRHAVALGLLQGPTELLPVSSSAHTTLIPWLAGWSYTELDPEQRKSFEIALHAGTGVALAIDMRKELLIGGAVAMALADARPARGTRRLKDAGPIDGVAIGIAQAVALIPGVSRNGATLTAARARGFSRRDAQALSWHAALPVILGASALECHRSVSSAAPEDTQGAPAAGAAAAFLSTLASAALVRRTSRGAGGRALLPCCVYRGVLALVVIRRLRCAHNGDG
jgi:undecaprenyl-diphosphatase